MSSRLTRRDFLSRSAALAACGLVAGQTRAAAGAPPLAATQVEEGPVFVSTWPFGKAANEVAMSTLTEGGDILDAIEQGIHVPEADPGNHSVGLGGTPKDRGVVQLDASIMDGRNHAAGSVAAISDIAHPITVARMVMERTRHVMLVGEGARRFALSQGLKPVDMLTDERREKWETWRLTHRDVSLQESHDTIALLGRTGGGVIAGGCSTSGWGYALHGRVGDSPIIGAGLYVDGEVGAAGATGIGENVMRQCGSFLVVEYMARGAHPQEACVETILRMGRKDPQPLAKMSVNFVALDRRGRWGGAGSDEGFAYSVTTGDTSQVVAGEHVTG